MAKSHFLAPQCLSVHMYQCGSHWTDFREILCWDFYESLLRNSEFGYNRTRILCTVHENLSAFILLRAVRNMLDSSANVTHFCVCVATLNGFLLLTATCMSTTIPWECIVAFPWQQCLLEYPKMVHYTYIAYIVVNNLL